MCGFHRFVEIIGHKLNGVFHFYCRTVDMESALILTKNGILLNPERATLSQMERFKS